MLRLLRFRPGCAAGLSYVKFIIFAAAVFAYGFTALTSSWNKLVYNKTIIKEQYYVDIGTCLADDGRNKARAA